jgi:prepilin-type N-terminal cleavage/methylation domain-containing protein
MRKTAKFPIHDIQYSFAYTLIEILVAMTIIGTLFGVGYANFRSFSSRQIVLGATKNMQGDIRSAQEMALSGQKPNDANCNSSGAYLDGYNFTVLSSTDYEIRAVCNGLPIGSALKTVNLSSGVTISSPLPSPNPIFFKVLGHGTNIGVGQSAVIRLIQTGTSNESTITIGSGGQIQ